MRPAPLAEPSLDTICVDRSILPLYPNWVKMVMHPDLEATGPAKYGLATVEPWLHDGQKNGGRMVGNRIYEHLLRNNMLGVDRRAVCLSGKRSHQAAIETPFEWQNHCRWALHGRPARLPAEEPVLRR